jgi:hypothetical protein
VILAIDPGVNGALAWGTVDRLRLVEQMPENVSGLYRALERTIHGVTPTRIIVEDVGMAFGPGVSAQSSYRFARHRGILEALLYTTFPHLNIEWVKPLVWQRVIIPRPPQTLKSRVQNGKEKRDTKALAHAYVTQNYFDFGVDKQCADAVCIWAYARQHHNPSKPTNTEV